MFVVSVIGVFQKLHSPDLPVSVTEFSILPKRAEIMEISRSPVFKPEDDACQGIVRMPGPIPGCAASLLGKLWQIPSSVCVFISHESR